MTLSDYCKHVFPVVSHTLWVEVQCSVASRCTFGELRIHHCFVSTLRKGAGAQSSVCQLHASAQRLWGRLSSQTTPCQLSDDAPRGLRRNTRSCQRTLLFPACTQHNDTYNGGARQICDFTRNVLICKCFASSWSLSYYLWWFVMEPIIGF